MVQHEDRGGRAEECPAADPRAVDVVRYDALFATTPHPEHVAWDDLAETFLYHDERTEKDGRGWSPTLYEEGATRGKRGVKAVTILALDVDHDDPNWSLIDGLEYVVHTTWKHFASDEHPGCRGRDDCPHHRIILPLTQPVPIDEWPEFRRRAAFWLCPNADKGAKDGPRFFWNPACRPGKPHHAWRHAGRWLDPDELRPVPAAQPRRTVATRRSSGGGATDDERPGDRFEREAGWLTDILPGWTGVGFSGDNMLVRRPGKASSWSGTISKRGDGVLYVFTDQASPLEPDTCYTKFGAYATLEHNGHRVISS